MLRIFTLNWFVSFTLVRWCPSLSAAIVTQLVTRAAFFSGMLSGGLSLNPATAQHWRLAGAPRLSVSSRQDRVRLPYRTRNGHAFPLLAI